jgi:hypothetical protein
MYPAEDTLIRVRLATQHARALQASIEIHLARMRALQERARSRPRLDALRDAALAAEIGEAARAGRRLAEDARAHRQCSRRLLEQSPRRREEVAAGERE